MLIQYAAGLSIPQPQSRVLIANKRTNQFIETAAKILCKILVCCVNGISHMRVRNGVKTH